MIINYVCYDNNSLSTTIIYCNYYHNYSIYYYNKGAYLIFKSNHNYFKEHILTPILYGYPYFAFSILCINIFIWLL